MHTLPRIPRLHNSETADSLEIRRCQKILHLYVPSPVRLRRKISCRLVFQATSRFAQNQSRILGLLLAFILIFPYYTINSYAVETIILNTRISGGMVTEGNSWANFDLKKDRGQDDSFYLSKIWLNFDTEMTRDSDSGFNLHLASYGPNSGTVSQEGGNGRYSLSGSDYYTWGSESNFNSEPRPSARQTGLNSQEGVLLRVDQAYLYFSILQTDLRVGKQNLQLGHGIAYSLDHQDGIQFKKEFELWNLYFGTRKIWEMRGIGKFFPAIGNVGGAEVRSNAQDDNLDDGNGSTDNLGGSSSMDRDDYYIQATVRPYEGLDVQLFGIMETMSDKKKYYTGVSAKGLFGPYSYDFEFDYMGGKISKGFPGFLGATLRDVNISAYAVLLGLGYDFDKFILGWEGFYGTGDNPDTDDVNEGFGGDADWGEDDKWDSGRRIVYDLFVDGKYPFSYDVTNKISNKIYMDISFDNNIWKIRPRIIHFMMENGKQGNKDNRDIGIEYNIEVNYRINQFFVYSMLAAYFTPGRAWGDNLDHAIRFSHQISTSF